MHHFEGLVRGAESRLNARLDKQSSSIDCLASKVESILDYISFQPREEEHTAETATDVPIEETYQTPPTIVFDDDTPVEEGDDVVFSGGDEGGSKAEAEPLRQRAFQNWKVEEGQDDVPCPWMVGQGQVYDIFKVAKGQGWG